MQRCYHELKSLIKYNWFCVRLKEFINSNDLTYSELAKKVNSHLSEYDYYDADDIYQILQGFSVSSESRRKAFSLVLTGNNNSFPNLLIPNLRALTCMMDQVVDELLSQIDTNQKLIRSLNILQEGGQKSYYSSLKKSTNSTVKLEEIYLAYTLSCYYKVRKNIQHSVSFKNGIKMVYKEFQEGLAARETMQQKVLTTIRSKISNSGCSSKIIRITILRLFIDYNEGFLV